MGPWERVAGMVAVKRERVVEKMVAIGRRIFGKKRATEIFLTHLKLEGATMKKNTSLWTFSWNDGVPTALTIFASPSLALYARSCI